MQARTMTLHPRLELVGTLVPRPESVARVASRVAGTVVEVNAVAGRAVGQGDVLVRLDETLLRANVERARAIVAEREAVLARLALGARKEELDAARGSLQRAEAVATGSARSLAALEELAAHGELSDVRLQQGRTAKDIADADVASARAALALLVAGTLPERSREAEASLAAARAELELAEASLGYSVVTTPIAGTLSRVDARLGAGVVPGTQVAEVTDSSRLLLKVRVPAALVGSLVPETACRLEFEGQVPSLEGHVDRFDPEADGATGGIWTYVAVTNPGSLSLGMRGRASLPLAPLEGCTAIPVAAAGERSGTPVATLIVDGRAREVDLQTGASSAGWVQILAGLSSGDWVATEGGYGLPDGQPVEVVPAGSD